jgi:hypothetical protein
VGNAPTVLDLVEESLDQILGSVKLRAEAERLISIAPWWDIRLGSMLADKRSDLVGIITSVNEQH